MSKNRLLIIDDEPDISAIIARVAKANGYDVKSTTDAGEFRALYGSWRPTHVSLDLQMPGTDGIEIIRFLGSKYSQARVLVVSGFDPRVVDTAFHLGAELGLTMAGSLLKPMRIEELQKVLLSLKESEG